MEVQLKKARTSGCFGCLTTDFNTYASDKAKCNGFYNNIISQGDIDKGFTYNHLVTKYYVTAGETYEKRLSNCVELKSKFPEDFSFLPMTTEIEMNLIWESISDFLKVFFRNKVLTLICSGKSTIHVMQLSVTSYYKLDLLFGVSLGTDDITGIKKIISGIKTENILLGGLFSVAAKKFHTGLDNNSYLKCSREYFLNIIHNKQKDEYPTVKGELGKMLEIIMKEICHENPKIVILGRP